MHPHITRVLFLLSALYWLMAAPAYAVTGPASAISYLDADKHRQIFAFVRGNNAHLVANHFDGTSWQWTDHGLPVGATSISHPVALTYVDSAGNRRIYVFAQANNHLVLRYWNGFVWQWVAQGGPAVFAEMSAITYVDSAGNRRIYLFAVDDDQSHLVVNYWDGSSWHWADLGVPAPGAYCTNTAAVTYIGDDGQRKIDVFCRGGVSAGFPLYVDSWDGSGWQWTNHGGTDVGAVSAVTYLDSSGTRRVYAFVKVGSSDLYTNYWNGSSWLWANLGVPAGEESSVLYEISAITYPDGANQRLYAFTEFSNQLFVKYWNGSTWNWASQGLPAGHTYVTSPSALTFLTTRGGSRRIYVFATGSNSDLVINYWNGSTWQWLDNGTL